MPGNSFREREWNLAWLEFIDWLQAQSEKGLFPCSPSQKDCHVILPPPSQDAESRKRSGQEKHSLSLFLLDSTCPETSRDKNDFCYFSSSMWTTLFSILFSKSWATHSLIDGYLWGQAQCTIRSTRFLPIQFFFSSKEFAFKKYIFINLILKCIIGEHGKRRGPCIYYECYVLN